MKKLTVLLACSIGLTPIIANATCSIKARFTAANYERFKFTNKSDENIFVRMCQADGTEYVDLLKVKANDSNNIDSYPSQAQTISIYAYGSKSDLEATDCSNPSSSGITPNAELDVDFEDNILVINNDGTTSSEYNKDQFMLRIEPTPSAADVSYTIVDNNNKNTDCTKKQGVFGGFQLKKNKYACDDTNWGAGSEVTMSGEYYIHSTQNKPTGDFDTKVLKLPPTDLTYYC